MGPSRLPKRTARTGNTAGGDLLAYPSGVGAPIIMTLQQHQRGVTLIELMVALAVLAIAASLAAPSFSDTIRNQRLSSRSFALQEDLAFARAEAVKLQSNVALAAPTGNLTDGWVVFEDTDADERLDGGERRIREQGPMNTGYSMQAMTGAGGPKAGIGFDRRGAVEGRNPLDVMLCAPGWSPSKNQSHARNVRVAANGRAMSGKGRGSNAHLPNCP